MPGLDDGGEPILLAMLAAGAQLQAGGDAAQIAVRQAL
jgi:hypothetical protein